MCLAISDFLFGKSQFILTQSLIKFYCLKIRNRFYGPYEVEICKLFLSFWTKHVLFSYQHTWKMELLLEHRKVREKGSYSSPLARLEKFTFGNPMVIGTVRKAKILEIVFIFPAAGFPSIPSSILH